MNFIKSSYYHGSKWLEYRKELMSVKLGKKRKKKVFQKMKPMHTIPSGLTTIKRCVGNGGRTSVFQGYRQSLGHCAFFTERFLEHVLRFTVARNREACTLTSCSGVKINRTPHHDYTENKEQLRKFKSHQKQTHTKQSGNVCMQNT